MTREELMELSAEKASRELTPESIEFLFQPRTFFELLLRCDFEGSCSAFHAAISDDSPDAMPYRFRDAPYRIGMRAIEVEEFYRAIKAKVTADEQA